MAPKNKFTREEMTDAALRVLQRGGIHAVTAQSIAQELGISTRPIFTCFATMEEVRKELHRASEERYMKYVEAGMQSEIPFFGFGMQYLRFAKEEPELYRLLFLSAPAEGREAAENGTMEEMKRSQESVRPYLMNIYHFDRPEADRYFRDLWLVVHSLATLIVTGSCPYDEREIGQILTGFSVSICKAIKEIPGFAEGNFERNQVFYELTGTKKTKA